ncbi:hypothetical protein [Streptomyces scopuliridis]|uniref:hypothetical protein n=1 Tax=Streptomyces scopuliridis TaxID=452529 RepID=UPI0035E0E1BF
MNQSFEIDSGTEFLIWHAQCSQDSAGTVCTFDVTSAGIRQIKDADREFVEVVVSALGLAESTPLGWTVERFYSPYYALSPDARAWEDRLSIVWRMAIRLNGVGEAFDYFGRMPTSVDQTDDTWDQSDESSWEMEGANCILIADGRSGDVQRVREIFPGNDISVLEYRDAVPITQVRINLGILGFPEQEELVQSGLSSCEGLGLATHCRDTCFRDMRWLM